MFDQVKCVTEPETSQAPLPGTRGQVTMQMLQGDPNPQKEGTVV